MIAIFKRIARVLGFGRNGGTKAPEADISKPVSGTLEYFNWDKGYGFVSCPGVHDRVFIHRTRLRGRYKIGDPLKVEIGKNSKGYFVKRLVPVRTGK